MSNPSVPPDGGTPGAASALYVLTFAWGIAGALACLILWPDSDDPDGPGLALLTLAVAWFAGTVSFASGAVLERMARWQAAGVEAVRG